ncbi:porin [Ramlibacter sp. G-1-2-2]|uniref:Porin n=1 Tax=Ramlibacter agri TaxID=2728837 RepID=A0A848GXD9_9BURK|nr:porin [Ramlibacter agri]NML42817.1 porin [Ramlibacter agri]
MKKTLIAFAATAAAGAACAGNGVPAVGLNMFGVLDATLAYGSASGGSHRVQLTNSGFNSSRLGFRGSEDLGGGLSASFWLEMGVNPDDGTGVASSTNNQQAAGGASAGSLTFNRASWVSLNGDWGSLRLGRDYTPTFTLMAGYDPFTVNGAGTTLAFTGFSIRRATAQGPYPASTSTSPGVAFPGGPVATRARASNSIGYMTGDNLGGFYGWAQYYLGENAQDGAATEDDGSGYNARFGYAAGPVDVSAAYGKTKYALLGDFRTWDVGGTWKLGNLQLNAEYVSDRAGGTTLTGGIGPAPLDGKGWMVGGSYVAGPGLVRFSYSGYKVDLGSGPVSRKAAIGYVYYLSKRTAVYTTYAHLWNRNGATSTLNGSLVGAGLASSASNGLDFGLKHSF